MADYVDPNGFEPLPVYLEGALAGFLESGSISHEDKALADELAALGYLSDVSFYLDGTGVVEVAPKGRYYFDEKSAWMARVADWQAIEEEHATKGMRHDWLLSVANGMYIVVGAILGFLLGRVF